MSDITPTDEQAKAIKAIVDWYGEKGRNEFYLAGYAGVGKSTIAALAIEEIKERHNAKNIRTAAYTGKAASVLRKKGNESAQTIHSLIYLPTVDKKTKELKFVLSEASAAADADLIVLDECSMIDDRLADDLRSFGKKILVMGDPGQLPPVNGQGAFTRDVPDVFLHEIHRQAADSPILELATLARKGERLPVGYSKNGIEVRLLTKETQELIYRQDTQPICGLNRVRWVYNKRLRARLGHGGQRPLPGEKLICCKNNHKEGIFNGGIGRLVSVSDSQARGRDVYSLSVAMEDLPSNVEDLLTDPVHFNNHFTEGKSEKVPGFKPSLNEFDFGYIVTCHKAQGSQWDHVTVIDDSIAFRENKDKWLYTALTRAESGLTLLTRP
ncbi:MAG: ATP-dependent RecD-like DNA helicase [Planctomycetes bacterium]|nr:ATP-dependent RecD-like DNA helicase [Planctomycetota bacterium]